VLQHHSFFALFQRESYCESSSVSVVCTMTPAQFVAWRDELFRVTTCLEFMETWKCQGILHRSGKRHNVRETSGNLCSQGYLIVTP